MNTTTATYSDSQCDNTYNGLSSEHGHSGARPGHRNMDCVVPSLYDCLSLAFASTWTRDIWGTDPGTCTPTTSPALSTSSATTLTWAFSSSTAMWGPVLGTGTLTVLCPRSTTARTCCGSTDGFFDFHIDSIYGAVFGWRGCRPCGSLGARLASL